MNINRRNLTVTMILMIFFLVFHSANAQKTIDDILYGDFREIESFGYIQVKVQQDQGAMIGLLDSAELTDYARLKFKNNFSGIPYLEIAAEESTLYQEEEKAKKVGSIWCRVWIVGEIYPIAYYIECKAGNYDHYEMWSDEVLGYCNEKEINQIVRNEINRMIENLAIVFFKVRGEI
ncbi:MAG: hypothetical protein JXC36_03280 [Candidatus Atribacteria bacterium]|nr:hypothetical protein [Candidatus Atribacteria bacterium]